MGAMVTAITGSIDYSAIVTGLGTVFGAVALVAIAFKGGKMLLSAVRGA